MAKVTMKMLVKDFNSGTLTLGVDDIGLTVAADLTGASTDDNGVLISASENVGTPVAVGFRAQKANGTYRYFWLYRVKFGLPASNLQTKADSITFSTPTIEGTVMRRNKLDGMGKHPWKQRSLKVTQVFHRLQSPVGLLKFTSRSTRRSLRRTTERPEPIAAITALLK